MVVQTLINKIKGLTDLFQIYNNRYIIGDMETSRVFRLLPISTNMCINQISSTILL